MKEQTTASYLVIPGKHVLYTKLVSMLHQSSSPAAFRSGGKCYTKDDLLMSKPIRLVELWDLRTIWADALSCACCLCLSVPNDIKNCRITYVYVNLSPWAIFPLPAI